MTLTIIHNYVSRFVDDFQKYDTKRVILSATFDNGIEEFRGVCLVLKNSLLKLYNSLDIYPPLPHSNRGDFHIQVTRPGVGLVTLFNYTEFDKDYNITYQEQFTITEIKIREDNNIYAEEFDKKISATKEKIDNVILNR